MINDKLTNAINLPLADMELLKELEPYLLLSEVMGSFLSQLSDSSIVSLEVESFGVVEEVKPIMLSLLKGLLKNVIDYRINYVNVLNIAEGGYQAQMTILQTMKEKLTFVNPPKGGRR